MDYELFGVRISTSQKKSLSATNEGDLYVAQNLPPYTLMTMNDRGWSVMTTSAVAALIVRPSTTALGTLWNGESDGGKSYVIDRIFTQQLVSAAAASRWGIWACVHPIGMAAVTADITAIKSSSGKTNYGGAARFDVGATVVDDGWFPWGNGFDVEATGTLGGNQSAPMIGGRLVIPPSAGLSIHVVASSVNEDFCVGASWYEVPSDLR